MQKMFSGKEPKRKKKKAAQIAAKPRPTPIRQKKKPKRSPIITLHDPGQSDKVRLRHRNTTGYLFLFL